MVLVKQSTLAIALLFLLSATAIAADVYQLSELNTRQIESLDHENTVILIPGGILEQHGPYLPSFSDGYVNLDDANQLSTDLSDLGWDVVVFPIVPLGSGGANEIGNKQVFAGTYAIRPETVRAVFMDIATELGEQGFRYIFILHGHGSPSHNMALDQAGLYFKDEFGGEMHNLFGIWSTSPSEVVLSEVARREDGFTVHAGAEETSSVLYVRPDLVADDVKAAPIVKGDNFTDLMRIASADGWTGYFGSPRQADASIGEKLAKARYKHHLELATKILRGEKLTNVMTHSSMAYGHPEMGEVVEKSRDEHSRRAKQQQDWIKRNNADL